MASLNIFESATHIGGKVLYDLVPGAKVPMSGTIMKRAGIGPAGNVLLDVATADADLPNVIGVAMLEQRRVSSIPVIAEEQTIPATGEIKMDHTNIVGTVAVVEKDTGTAVVPTAVDLAKGILTFPTTLEDTVILISYSFAPTIKEADVIFGSNFQRNTWDDMENKVAIAIGVCHIFTLCYDTSKTYTFDTVLAPDADGKFTVGAGTLTDTPFRVISVPSASNPYLGVTYNSQG